MVIVTLKKIDIKTELLYIQPINRAIFYQTYDKTSSDYRSDKAWPYSTWNVII